MRLTNKICDCGRPATKKHLGQMVCERCYDARDLVGGPTLVSGVGKKMRKAK